MAENIQNIAAITLGAIGDKDLIIRDIHTVFAVIVLRDCVTEKFVTLLRTVAAEGFPMGELIDRPVHRLDCRGRKRLGDVPDAAPDQRLSQLRMFIAKCANSASDFWKKISAFELEIVVVYIRHRRAERQ
jgi:hypothetical protein